MLSKLATDHTILKFVCCPVNGRALGYMWCGVLRL